MSDLLSGRKEGSSNSLVTVMADEYSTVNQTRTNTHTMYLAFISARYAIYIASIIIKHQYILAGKAYAAES